MDKNRVYNLSFANFLSAIQTGWKKTESQEVPPEGAILSEYLDDLKIAFSSTLEVSILALSVIPFPFFWYGVVSIHWEFGAFAVGSGLLFRSCFHVCSNFCTSYWCGVPCAVLGKKTRTFDSNRGFLRYGNLCRHFEGFRIKPKVEKGAPTSTGSPGEEAC